MIKVALVSVGCLMQQWTLLAWGSIAAYLFVLCNGRFIRISNTPAAYTCHLYGAKEGKEFMCALFRSSVADGALQIHAKTYKNGLAAEEVVGEELFAKHCPLSSKVKLVENIKGLLTNTLPDYSKMKCERVLRRETIMTSAYDNFKSKIDISLYNGLNNVYRIGDPSAKAVDCEAILTSMDGARISMHQDTFNMIAEYAASMNTTADAIIRRLYEKRALSVNYYQVVVGRLQVNTDGTSSLVRAPKSQLEWKDQIPNVNSNYLSTDEQLLASLLQVSSPTRFISDCKFGDANPNSDHGRTFIKEGVISLVVGARFDYDELMDSLFMIEGKDLGDQLVDDPKMPIVQILYKYYFGNGHEHWKPSTKIEPVDVTRYIKYKYSSIDRYFDMMVYKKRLRLSMLPFILDAEDRAKEAKKQAVLLVSGWGLSKWTIYNIKEQQSTIFVNEFIAILGELCGQGRLRNISHVLFNHIDCDKGKVNLNQICQPTIKQELVKVNPANKKQLKQHVGDLTKKLLVYAVSSDGLAYPGNQYWMGSRGGSVDAAAATCSAITATLNPDINPGFMERYQVFR